MSISPENSSATSDDRQDAHSPSSSPQAPSSALEQTVTYRMAPSMTGFVVAGLLLGMIVAFFSTLLGPGSAQYTFGSVFGVLAVIFGAIGAACGALVALILDKISLKRAQTYRAIPED